LHVAGARAHILGGDVAAAQPLHEATVRPEEHFTVLRAVVADDHRLPAAQIESGNGILVRHPARQPECVDYGLFVGGVAPEARPAERRPERGAVDGDDAAVAARGVARNDELLVPHLGDPVEDALLGGWCGDLGYGHGLELNGVARAVARMEAAALVGVQLPRNDDALDLGSSLVYLGGLGVAEVALHWIVLHVAVAAEDLNCLRGDPHGGL